jgi:oxygen-independent coproporphyrinogen-3 oxidase
MEELERDLETLKQWNPPHISAYLLTLNEDHILRTHPAMKNRLADDDLAEKLYLRLCEVLRERGYEHYETSNFARPGFRSFHNSNYWNPESSYLGLGPGAHGYFADLGLRYQTLKDPMEWMSSKSGVGSVEKLDAEQQSLEKFYLHLREDIYHKEAFQLVNLLLTSFLKYNQPPFYSQENPLNEVLLLKLLNVF